MAGSTAFQSYWAAAYRLADLIGVQVQRGAVGEEAAVEALEGMAQDHRDASRRAGVHLAEELGGEGLELRGLGADGIEQVGEAGGGQQAHVLGEHAEEAAAEEIGHLARAMPGLFEGLGELGQQLGDGASDGGGMARGIKGVRVGPDQSQALADFRPAQLLHADAEGQRMGEVRGSCGPAWVKSAKTSMLLPTSTTSRKGGLGSLGGSART